MHYLKIETNYEKLQVRAAVQELAYAKAEVNRELVAYNRNPIAIKKQHYDQAMRFWGETKQIAVPMLNKAMRKLGYSLTYRVAFIQKQTDFGN